MARKITAKQGWIIMRGSEYEFPPNIYDTKKRCEEVIKNLKDIDPIKYSGLTPKDLSGKSKVSKPKKKTKAKREYNPIINDESVILDI